jgi:histone acetyltransferase SAS3
VSKIASVVSLAMAEPIQLGGQGADDTDPEDMDAEGEYEDDVVYEQATAEHTQEEDGGRDTDAEGSDEDAEGEEVDEDDDSEPVGAVKIAAPESVFSEEDYEHDGNARGDLTSNAKTSDSENESDSGSDAENHWEAQTEDGDEPEAEATDPNLCV